MPGLPQSQSCGEATGLLDQATDQNPHEVEGGAAVADDELKRDALQLQLKNEEVGHRQRSCFIRSVAQERGSG